MRMTRVMHRLAILYQANIPPPRNGSNKPMKAGGYSDSGADIACGLLDHGDSTVQIITPNPNPSMENDLDWVFPDTVLGIETALGKGANVLWLNTVLYAGHPVEKFLDYSDLEFVGQIPVNTDIYDNKWTTNSHLRENGLPVPTGLVINKDTDYEVSGWTFPLVLKPPLGRGSQGVTLVQDLDHLHHSVQQLFQEKRYGNSLYIENYLPGKEITVTVMPPGKYTLLGEVREHSSFWSLPAVSRFNHIDGVAPYSGIVAVVHNSCVLDDTELQSDYMRSVYAACEKAADLVGARAPIRVDCRADSNGKYWLFDVNMKPNMTGPSRPHRAEQDSLTLLAARKYGWGYGDLLINMLGQRWKGTDL